MIRLFRLRLAGGSVYVSVPREILAKLGAKAGDYVYWKDREGEVYLKKAEIR